MTLQQSVHHDATELTENTRARGTFVVLLMAAFTGALIWILAIWKLIELAA